MQFHSIDEHSQYISCIIGVIDNTHRKSILNVKGLSEKDFGASLETKEEDLRRHRETP